MAVKIRSSKDMVCDSCGKSKRNNKSLELFDVGIINCSQARIITLCDECMHTLLQKLIIVGRKENEVR